MDVARDGGLGTASGCGDEAHAVLARWNALTSNSSADVECLVPRAPVRPVRAERCAEAATSASAYANLVYTLDNRFVYLIDSPTQGHAALYAETQTERTTGALLVVLGLVVFIGAAISACWGRLADYAVHRPLQLRRHGLRRTRQWKDARD